MEETFTGMNTLLIIGLVSAWILQLGLSLWQMRRFHARVRELRKDGRVSVGLEGGTYKGKVYTVLVIDEQEKVRHAEKLSGITVFEGLKPVPALVGQPVALLLNEGAEFPIRKKVLASFRKAAEAFYPTPDEDPGADENVLP